MRITSVTRQDIEAAMRLSNENLQFKRFDAVGRGFNVTLRVASSDGAFAKIGYSGRKTVAACWHGHFDFLDNLFYIAPGAVVSNAHATYHGQGDFLLNAPKAGNRNIRSITRPLRYRDACKCNYALYSQ